MNFVIVSTRPPKPREGRPCNGCGYCCTREVCGVGLIAYPDAVAPCPALVARPDGMRCAIVETEGAAGMEPLIRNALGIGRGCDAADPPPPKDCA